MGGPMTNKKKQKWYCYVCGDAVGPQFYLMSMQRRTDRVFLCCMKCHLSPERGTLLILVQESEDR